MKNKIDMSIVITVHNEGILLHKTLLSVFDAAKLLIKEEVGYEIILHVDNGDKKTTDYLKRYEKDSTIRIVNNSFGDLGESRNYAVGIAKGKYVSFLDGDDLISANWYLEAWKELESSDKEAVVYPEAVLTFQNDDSHVLTIQKCFGGAKSDYLTIMSANPWGSVVAGRKETFEKVPYMLMSDGYCFEDYAFNVQTLEKGISHIVAKSTVLFYRRSGESMLARANNGNLILPWMKLFDLPNIKEMFKDEKCFDCDGLDGLYGNVLEKKRRTFRDNYVYKKVRGNWLLNYLITPFLRLALDVRKGIKRVDDEKRIVPEFVLEEWKRINRIEIQLYPRQADLNGITLYDASESIDIGRSYAYLSRAFSHIPDYIFIVPWLVMGGADRVLLNYIDALKKLHPQWHIAVITTLPADNKWEKKLPDDVDFYDLGKTTEYLSVGGVDVLLSLLLTQLQCRRLHIINSELGYRWVRDHSLLVRKNYEVNASFFAEERVNEGDGERIVSFENPCLFDVYYDIKNIFTDNKNIIDIVVARNAFDEEKFKVHYQPINVRIKNRDNNRIRTKKVLWAGRIDIVKMPELVLEIAERLDDVQIDIYGTIANDCYNEQMFDGIKNARYCGEYKGFDELPTDDYDLFLYTSRNDGIPNTILEATAAGLPIIASNDGGVGEFIINKKTGILIEDFERPDGYVKAINDIYDNKFELEKMVKNAQKALKKQHGWEEFLKKVKKDIG